MLNLKTIIAVLLTCMTSISHAEVTPRNLNFSKEVLKRISKYLPQGKYQGVVKPGNPETCIVQVSTNSTKYQINIQHQRSQKTVVFDLNDSVNTPTNGVNGMGGTWVGSWLGDMKNEAERNLYPKAAVRISWEGGKVVSSDGEKYREYGYLLQMSHPTQTKAEKFVGVRIGSKLFYKAGFGSKTCYLKM